MSCELEHAIAFGNQARRYHEERDHHRHNGDHYRVWYANEPPKEKRCNHIRQNKAEYSDDRDKARPVEWQSPDVFNNSQNIHFSGLHACPLTFDSSRPSSGEPAIYGNGFQVQRI